MSIVGGGGTQTAIAGADVIVIGGGLHGCSAALYLALAGLRPLVLEKDYIGRHASGVNAGGVRRLGRHFAEIPLAVAAMDIWHDIEALVGDDCGFAISSQIKIAENKAELANLTRRAEQVRALGFDHEEPIDAEELKRLVPAIAPHCVGGLIARRDGHANPYRTVMAFKRRAESLGVQFHEGICASTVERVGTRWRVRTASGDFEAAVLVNCAGAWAERIARQLGEPVPLRAELPMLMISERIRPFLKPVLGAAGRPLSFKQFGNGTLLIGGGHRGRCDRDSGANTLNFKGLALSARTVTELFPMLREVRVVRCWGGIEGVMPDEIPVIGPSRTAEAAYHAFGFSAHGFQLGPIVGRIIAELVTEGHSSLPIEAFRIDRFNMPEAFDV